MSDLPAPSPWITRFARRIGDGTAVLDLACGSGRHARWAVEQGSAVTVVDRDISGVVDLSDRIETIEADLEDGPWPFDDRRFDVVIVTNYLHRPLFPKLIDALNGTGLLLYETFMLGQEEIGRPRNPDFLLRPGELLEALTPALQPVAFEQGRVDLPTEKIVQRIAAVNTAAPVRIPPPGQPTGV